jgi:VIT1/CCC1 family predicted Fe2+/Mn2+ transporter
VHLSKPEIELYHRRALSPAQLLAVDDHLQVCAACRREIARDEPLAAAAAAWEPLLGRAGSAAPVLPDLRPRRRWLAPISLLVVGVAASLLALLGAVIMRRRCRTGARRLPGRRRSAQPRSRRGPRIRPGEGN